MVGESSFAGVSLSWARKGLVYTVTRALTSCVLLLCHVRMTDTACLSASASSDPHTLCALLPPLKKRVDREVPLIGWLFQSCVFYLDELWAPACYLGRQVIISLPQLCTPCAPCAPWVLTAAMTGRTRATVKEYHGNNDLLPGWI